MSKRTKKVGSVGRYQARYGVRARTVTRNIEIIQKRKQECPTCGHKKVKRISTGIWQCRKCGAKYTGGAYIPQTESGQNVEKMLKGEFELPELPTEEPKEVVSKGGKK
jgi:large subunit ribosomal protein L37Ae